MPNINLAYVRAMVEENRQSLEMQIKDSETIFHSIKNIKSMEELNALIKTTEKRISYMQARIEQNDWFLMEVVPVQEDEIDPSKIFQTRREPAPDIVIPKSTDPAYVVRYDDGNVAITPTVRKLADMMKVGQVVKPKEFIAELIEKGLITASSSSGIRKAFIGCLNLKRTDYGVYERT